MKIPDIFTANKILSDAAYRNPGQWVMHCQYAAQAAEKIAVRCAHMNPKHAYILALLHDIGRREGVTHMRHILDGYYHMKSLSYEDSARICLTHSFPIKTVLCFSGKNDCTKKENEFIQNFLSSVQYTEYDLLIQLCDAVASANGFVLIENRLDDVTKRNGSNKYTESKKTEFFRIKKFFDIAAQADIYSVLNVLT